MADADQQHASSGPGTGPTPSERLIERPWLQLAGVVLALALLALVLFGALATLVGILETNGAPNPFVADGAFCCGHPDSWGQVAQGTALTSTVAALTMSGLVAAVVLLGNKRVPWRSLLPGPAAAAALAAVVIAVGVVLDLGNLRSAPDCDTFAVDRNLPGEPWTDRRDQETVLGIARCGGLIGKTPRQVEAALGKEGTGGTAPDDPLRFGSLLRVVFDEQGRAVSVKIDSPSEVGFND